MASRVGCPWILCWRGDLTSWAVPLFSAATDTHVQKRWVCPWCLWWWNSVPCFPWYLFVPVAKLVSLAGRILSRFTAGHAHAKYGEGGRHKHPFWWCCRAIAIRLRGSRPPNSPVSSLYNGVSSSSSCIRTLDTRRRSKYITHTHKQDAKRTRCFCAAAIYRGISST